MSAAIVLRSHQPADVPQLARLFHDAVHQTAGAHYTLEQRAAWSPPSPDLTRWRERLARQQVLLAESAGVLAGFCSWTVEGYLDLLFVDPAHGRRGVATTLYQAAEKSLRDHGATRVHTQASVTAQPFFLRQGFRVVRHQIVPTRGVDLPNAVMEKWLT
ncbi:putative N-acetyltransferase YafP [Lacunisphaera limnophila]|uniref:Putative N-acetyltransferase YafP n=1 Tax=Lacunisphaera limnophila TaxID=1838286 RepID=A0A1D8AUK8_9BACT|nr:GNAT family N-acetyltransferase [Lacunisphaera limnophila]AOS44573.1 putative N-acetyltransferase YafP [Lacunisphaera limnophila]